jgi:hypothetical protein
MGRRRRKQSGDEPRIDMAARLAPYVRADADDRDPTPAPQPVSGGADDDDRSGVTPGQSR